MKFQLLLRGFASYYFLIIHKKMKISLFLLLVAILQLSAENTYSQMTLLSFSLQNKTIEEVMDQIEQETEFSFLVLDNELEINKPVNVNVSKQSIVHVLDHLFVNTNIRYKIVDRQIVLMDKAHTAVAVTQQDKRQISGFVYDETGEPIVGANVLEKGTTNGIITDIDGKFSLDIDPGAVLQVSYIGYVTQELAIHN